jgi:hypothetical protein
MIRTPVTLNGTLPTTYTTASQELIQLKEMVDSAMHPPAMEPFASVGSAKLTTSLSQVAPRPDVVLSAQCLCSESDFRMAHLTSTHRKQANPDV